MPRLFIFLLLCRVYVPVCVCVSVREREGRSEGWREVTVRGQYAGIKALFLLCCSQRSNSGCPGPWSQALPTEPSCWLIFGVPLNFFSDLFMCVHSCVGTCTLVHVWKTGQLAGVGSLLSSFGSWGSKLGGETWQQALPLSILTPSLPALYALRAAY